MTQPPADKLADILKPAPAESHAKSWNGMHVYAVDPADPSGKPIVDRGGDVRNDAASLTKMMTFYLTLEKIDQLRKEGIDPASVVITVSPHAADARPITHVTAGEQLTLPKALDALMTASDNGAAVALSEWVGGDFVKQMNDKASELGMKDTTFYNPNGLPFYGEWKSGNALHKGDKHGHNSQTTAHDMATMIMALNRDFHDASKEYMGKGEVRYGPGDTRYGAHHHLLDSDPAMRDVELPEGFKEIAKTGLTNAAGYGIASLITGPTGKQLAVVVLQSDNLGTVKARQEGVPDALIPVSQPRPRGHKKKDIARRKCLGQSRAINLCTICR